ncbi:hypothetical protein QBC46DRAFT_38375 [Diplogelasinospora grovesii]|uniref:Secreted protein n=1 Tax=Diplogelasinospora grovesii TaxID=303347 RepID=A0AAN6S0J4_9PEZI|nr:hypothetical protein QBC46DRAFT_38375 [Diplogelasinospora grovesii]
MPISWLSICERSLLFPFVLLSSWTFTNRQQNMVVKVRKGNTSAIRCSTGLFCRTPIRLHQFETRYEGGNDSGRCLAFPATWARQSRAVESLDLTRFLHTMVAHTHDCGHTVIGPARGLFLGALSCLWIAHSGYFRDQDGRWAPPDQAGRNYQIRVPQR